MLALTIESRSGPPFRPEITVTFLIDNPHGKVSREVYVVYGVRMVKARGVRSGAESAVGVQLRRVRRG